MKLTAEFSVYGLQFPVHSEEADLNLRFTENS